MNYKVLFETVLRIVSAITADTQVKEITFDDELQLLSVHLYSDVITHRAIKSIMGLYDNYEIPAFIVADERENDDYGLQIRVFMYEVKGWRDEQ